MKKTIVCLTTAAAAALACSFRPTARAEDEGEIEGGDGGGSVVVRPQRDVACDLRLASGATALSPGDVRLVVRNKGRRAARSVGLAVFADATSGTPLWTGTASILAHHRVTRHLALTVPSGTAALVAVATCSGDQQPGNNMDREDFGQTAHTPYATAGAANYAANCASCHGADARGTSSAPRIVGRSAGDVFEAVREGEDGMPRFLGVTWQDAQDLAAFLVDPTAPTDPIPPPPPPPTPAGQTPTYAADVKPILGASCTSCHTGTAAPAGIRLDTYATASANASRALSAMQAGRMPPGGPLPAATIQVVSDWIAAGKVR